ncbi:MAG: leucine-rich repeat domain-containing protein, partial [Rhodothermia bacterium]
LLLIVLMSATTASGQYTFTDWARDHGYSTVMPGRVDASYSSPAIESLNGIERFDWTTIPTTVLILSGNELRNIESGNFDGLTDLETLKLSSNRLSSIESGDFDGLANLKTLSLYNNQLSSIESDDFDGLPNLRVLSLHNNRISNIQSGAFSGLPNLMDLRLYGNLAMTDLNLAGADFSSLTSFDVENNANITSVSLRRTVVNQTSLAALMDAGNSWFGPTPTGIGELDGITEMDLSGVDFVKITDLEPLYVMDDLTDLWLVATLNLDAFDLDLLLDNLVTIEGTSTEGILYMTQADFDAFNTAGGGLLAAWDAEPGHHVQVVPEPSTLLLASISLLGLCGVRSQKAAMTHSSASTPAALKHANASLVGPRSPPAIALRASYARFKRGVPFQGVRGWPVENPRISGATRWPQAFAISQRRMRTAIWDAVASGTFVEYLPSRRTQYRHPTGCRTREGK